MIELFDFVTEKGTNDILEWANGLQKQDRARLEQKLMRLTQISHELARDTRLLAGPIYRHIWKVRVNASVMLRPHLCRGPVDNQREYTLLVGAIEKGDRLPDGIEKTVTDRYEKVRQNAVERRIKHGRAGVL